MKAQTAQRIVNEILRDLDDRRGFHLISELLNDDPEVYRELYGSCVKRVHKAVAAEEDTFGNHDPPQEDLYFPEDYDGEL